MKIKLINGKNVNVGVGHASYDWEGSEVVEKIEGSVIYFKNCSTVNWYTVDMPWEIEE